MAIHDHFEVQILVNGRPLPEYQASDTDDANLPVAIDFPIVHRFVQAPSDVEFSIRAKILPGYVYASDSISIRIAVDGQKCSARALEKVKYKVNSDYTSISHGRRYEQDGQYFCKPYRFEKLQVTEEDVKPSEMTLNVQQLGRIEVDVWRSSYRDISDTKIVTEKKGSKRDVPKDSRTSRQYTTDFHEPQPIPEKALKGRAIELSARLGDPTTLSELNYIDVQRLGSSPLVKFCFDYRSRRALQSMYVIEKTPEPILSEQPELDGLSREELLELLEKQDAAANRALQIKTEMMGDTKPANNLLKRPAPVESSTDDEIEMTIMPKRLKPPVIIDLIDSD